MIKKHIPPQSRWQKLHLNQPLSWAAHHPTDHYRFWLEAPLGSRTASASYHKKVSQSRYTPAPAEWAHGESSSPCNSPSGPQTPLWGCNPHAHTPLSSSVSSGRGCTRTEGSWAPLGPRWKRRRFSLSWWGREEGGMGREGGLLRDRLPPPPLPCRPFWERCTRCSCGWRRLGWISGSLLFSLLVLLLELESGEMGYLSELLY